MRPSSGRGETPSWSPLSLATLSGTWADDYGNSGTFQYSPPAPAPGSPRLITLKGEYSVIYNAAASGDRGSSAISFGRLLAAAPNAALANIIPKTGPPTANCPGTFSAPAAAPGVLCLYERSHVNLSVLPLLFGNTNFNGPRIQWPARSGPPAAPSFRAGRRQSAPCLGEP